MGKVVREPKDEGKATGQDSTDSKEESPKEKSSDQEESKDDQDAEDVEQDSDSDEDSDDDSSEDDDSDEKSSKKKKSGDKSSKKEESKEKKPKKPPIYKTPAFIVAVSVLAAVLLIGGIILWLILRQYVSTDDAFVDGHIVQIAPQVSAQVVALHVDDNELMHKGDLLVELDPTDYLVALQQAEAQVSEAHGRLEQARAQIESARANLPQALAQQYAAEASLGNSANDFNRYKNVDARARSQQQLENAGNNFTNAQSRLEVAKAQVVSAGANVTTAEASAKAAEGELKTAEANERRAEVNLGYCKIFAPMEGRVTERTVEEGNYVTVGQALFMLVDPNVWVTANFKETQLTHMRPGQPVTIHVDAFPQQKFQGKIDSIQAGSGSRFSILPAENATGNYVKIVQRVPVKILFDHDANTNNAPMLSPGLSVEPRVKVR